MLMVGAVFLLGKLAIFTGDWTLTGLLLGGPYSTLLDVSESPRLCTASHWLPHCLLADTMEQFKKEVIVLVLQCLILL